MPTHPLDSTHWTQLVRKYMAQRQEALLIQAIAAAKGQAEPGVAALLMALHEGDMEWVVSAARKIERKFRWQRRKSEALTVRLIPLYVKAHLAEVHLHREIPPDRQADALSIGLAACDDAIKSCQLLRDTRCLALYQSIKGEALLSLGQLQEAKEACRESSNLYRLAVQAEGNTYAPDLARALDSLGQVLIALGHADEATAAFVEVIDVCTPLAEIDVASHAPALVVTLTRLGRVLIELGQFSQAKAVLQELLHWLEQLEQVYPREYSTFHARTLNQLGRIQKALGELDAAETSYQYAEQHLRELTKIGSQDCQLQLAGTLNDLGSLLCDTLRPEDALIKSQEAVGILRTLVAQDETLSLDLVYALRTHAAALSWVRRLDESQAAATEAVDRVRQWQQSAPETYVEQLAPSLALLGSILAELGERKEAEKCLREAIELYEHLERLAPSRRLLELATCLNGLGNLLKERQSYEEAHNCMQEGVRMLRLLASSHPEIYTSELAMAVNNLGNLLREQERLEEAEAALREALELQQGSSSPPVQHAARQAAILTNLGSMLAYLGHLEEAESALQEAVELERSTAPMSPAFFEPILANSLGNLGDVLRLRHQLGSARAVLEEALLIRRSLQQEQSLVYGPKLAITLNNLALVLIELGHLEDAEDALQEVVELYQSMRQLSDYDFIPDVSLAYSNLGLVLTELGQYEPAEAVLHEAVALYRRLTNDHPRQYSNHLATALTNLGSCLDVLGTQTEAEAALREAAKILRPFVTAHPTVYGRYQAITLYNLGVVLLKRGHMDEAVRTYQEAISVDPHYMTGARAAAIADLSRLYLSNGELQDAYELLATALSELESKRHQLPAREDRQAFQAGYASLYTRMVSLCLKLGRAEDAWHWVERSKGRTLLDLLGSARPRLRGTNAQSTYDRWQHVRQQILELEEELYLQDGPYQGGSSRLLGEQIYFNSHAEQRFDEKLVRLDELLTEELSLQRQLVGLLDEGRELVQVSTPMPSELAADLRRVTLERIPTTVASAHGPDHAPQPLLVEYFVLDDTHYAVFLVPLWHDGDGGAPELEVHEVQLPEELLTQTLSALTHCLFIGRSQLFGRTDLGGNVLVLDHDTDNATLSAIMAGEYLPEHATPEETFAYLPTQLSKLALEPWVSRLLDLSPTELIIVPHGALHLLPLHAALLPDGTPVAERFPTSYLPSAAFASALANRPREGHNPSGRLIMGPPSEAALPYAAIEALTLAEEWGLAEMKQPYMNEQMKVEVLVQHSRHLEVLHLATHSTFHEQDCLQSFLMFHKERLTILDLISNEALDFHGMKLCYVSSCESGLSQVRAGDDLQGLVWALTYAGADAVMASLWPVHDEAGEYMASAFYYHWAQGNTLMQAYQLAIKQLRSEPRFSNPYYWAPFVLFGNGFARA